MPDKKKSKKALSNAVMEYTKRGMARLRLPWEFGWLNPVWFEHTICAAVNRAMVTRALLRTIVETVSV